jgi:hypothetical protein
MADDFRIGVHTAYTTPSPRLPRVYAGRGDDRVQTGMAITLTPLVRTDGQGFEPWRRFHVNTLSRRAP